MEVQLLRHATLLITIHNRKLLVDPMLGEIGVMPPIANSPKPQRNPLVKLGRELNFLQDIDGVLLTHIHRDHFDEAAIEQLPKDKPIFCQPEDEKKLKDLGFLVVHSVADTYCWQGITMHRTTGQHGTGEVAKQMAPVSGYILQMQGEPSLYIAGDTIYYEEVAHIIVQYQPDVIVVNAGGARFITGDPITMTAQDVVSVCRQTSQATVIAVHMEAINHCLVLRRELYEYIVQEGVMDQVLIPKDGDKITVLAK